jgi:azurin
MKILSSLLTLALFSQSVLAAPEVKVKIGVAQLHYDKTSFNAEPGAKVTITFENNDELAHNLVVCRGGEDAWKTLADAALKLGEAGEAKGWLPESELIISATRMLKPREKQTITFVAPDKDGIYPYVCTFPGHALVMRGQMFVTKFPRGLGDLRYRYYEGSWSKLPDFSKLKPAAVGKIEDNKITITPRKRDDAFGFVFEGDLIAPLEGEYLFSTGSDDGSRLLIDGKVVVDNDGSHPPQQISGKVRLTQGSHRLEVQYFEAGGGEELAVAWAGPGFKMEPLSAGGSLKFTDPTEFQPPVLDKAKVVRVLLPNASSRSMAVGLPGGVNFCFDAETCSVRYAWSGGFVDVSPERGNGSGRGGGVCRPLGTIWKVGDSGKSPLSLGANDTTPRFDGYRIDGQTIEFNFRVDGLPIRQRISAAPDGNGLVYRFTADQKIPEAAKLQFADGDNIDVQLFAGDRLSATISPKK